MMQLSAAWHARCAAMRPGHARLRRRQGQPRTNVHPQLRMLLRTRKWPQPRQAWLTRCSTSTLSPVHLHALSGDVASGRRMVLTESVFVAGCGHMLPKTLLLLIICAQGQLH